MNQKNIEYIISQLLEEMKILDDEVLTNTPRRVANLFVNEIFTGLNNDNFPKITTFPTEKQCLIEVDNIGVYSMCRHHLLPFFGTAKIKYIPNGKILGLSKFARIVNFYSRQPQLQEDLTSDIYSKLSELLDTKDLIVEIEAEHMCVKMRIANSQNSKFKTIFGQII